MAESHGHSKAAWTGTGIILLASLLICFGIVFATALLWVPGVIGVVAGVVAWVAMEKAGYGEHHDERSPGTHAVR